MSMILIIREMQMNHKNHLTPIRMAIKKTEKGRKTGRGKGR